jgi:hypothetical protein
LLESIGKNLVSAGITDGGELWLEIMARVIKACNPMSESQREELLGPCLDALEYLEEQNNAKETVSELQTDCREG